MKEGFYPAGLWILLIAGAGLARAAPDPHLSPVGGSSLDTGGGGNRVQGTTEGSFL